MSWEMCTEQTKPLSAIIVGEPKKIPMCVFKNKQGHEWIQVFMINGKMHIEASSGLVLELFSSNTLGIRIKQ